MKTLTNIYQIVCLKQFITNNLKCLINFPIVFESHCRKDIVTLILLQHLIMVSISKVIKSDSFNNRW